MLKSSARAEIRLRGVRQNNLKNLDLDLPLKQLIVVTGLSGSGKSSLAFDTLFAEGQRRYIETFSPYARQFFDRMDKPQVDSIEGIPPAIAIEQRNAVKTTRSTVGTMTEICDYMKMLWPHVATLHCRQCQEPVRKDSPRSIWETVAAGKSPGEGTGEKVDDVFVTFDLPLSEKLSLDESLELVSRQGYQRLLVAGTAVRLDELKGTEVVQKNLGKVLTIIQDRVRATAEHRARFVDACEQAYHFGKGRLTIWEVSALGSAVKPRPFSKHLHCARCDIEYWEPSPALFSFNHPVGACPKCRGFGRVISIDYSLAIPDASKTLAEGVVKPWLTGQGAECQMNLLRMCRQLKIPTNIPFNKLSEKWQRFVVDGEPDYGKDEEHEWPRAWYGVKGYFRWLESKAYKMHVRVLLSRYRAYTPCPDCQGTRFQPESLLYRMTIPVELAGAKVSVPGAMTLSDFYQLPVRDALQVAESLYRTVKAKNNDPRSLLLKEIRSRLGYLDEVGLSYLTLDRPTRSLSGGETERVNLTTCLGTCLVNTLFILDEPSVGLHPRDTDRLVGILKRLRDTGNTVVVVEHEPGVMRAADRIIDLGPGHGATGGEIVFQGTYRQILGDKKSLTGLYLSGTKTMDAAAQARAVRMPELTLTRNGRYPSTLGRAMSLKDSPIPLFPDGTNTFLTLENVTRHNLKNVTVRIPLGRLVCVTGVSGSGKSTLIRDGLLPALTRKLTSEKPDGKDADRPASVRPEEDEGAGETAADPGSVRLSGHEELSRVLLVDQSSLGKTPRSNPAVYTGAFDDIREVFAQSEVARQRGLNASAFSFNSGQGQCERCRGAGFEKIEMQFLSDVYIRCPDCNGRRYRSHILEIKVEGGSGHAWSVADLLESTIDETIDFLSGFSDSRPAHRATNALRLLQEVGLGYLKLGQPINTLSGGESQRLKLVRHLSEVREAALPSRYTPSKKTVENGVRLKPVMFLFDEPTTGLHFEDVRILLKAFQRLVKAGHSVVVIEHNLDVIRNADWVIDLGPEAGDQGGQIVAEGTPNEIAANPESRTGQALRESADLTSAAARIQSLRKERV
jgi:excinuclease ABC subunit A